MVAQIRILELTAGVAIGAPLGGAARFVVELTKAFDDSQIQPYLACIWKYDTPPETNWQAVLQQHSIAHSFAAEWNDRRPLMSCVHGLHGLRQLRGTAPDIIHSHGEFTDIAALFLKRTLGARYLVRTRHSTIEWPKRPALGRLFGDWLYPALFDAEVAVSRTSTAALDQRKPARWLHRKATTIYNAIDFDRFTGSESKRASARQRLQLDSTAPILGTIGALVTNKDVDMVLQSLSYVLQVIGDAVLVIVGDGPERPQLECRAAELGIAKHVVFLGAQTAIEEIIAAFDLYVSGSLVEGLPTVLLESIAAGVPVITTDISGNNEVIENGVTGRLIPTKAPKLMADAVVEALSNADHTQKMAQAALLDIRARFDIRSIAAQYTRLFQELMAAHQDSPTQLFPP
jgi:glycosyltransferase involved in cell wall biosynthesis